MRPYQQFPFQPTGLPKALKSAARLHPADNRISELSDGLRFLRQIPT